MTQGRPTAAPAIWPYENTPLSHTFEWRLPPVVPQIMKGWAQGPREIARRLKIEADHARYERERRSVAR